MPRPDAPQFPGRLQEQSGSSTTSDRSVIDRLFPHEQAELDRETRAALAGISLAEQWHIDIKEQKPDHQSAVDLERDDQAIRREQAKHYLTRTVVLAAAGLVVRRIFR